MKRAHKTKSIKPIINIGHFTDPRMKNTTAKMDLKNFKKIPAEMTKWFFVISRPTRKYPKPSTKPKIKKPYIQKNTSLVAVEKPKNEKKAGNIGAKIANAMQANIFHKPAKKNRNL